MQSEEQTPNTSSPSASSDLQQPPQSDPLPQQSFVEEPKEEIVKRLQSATLRNGEVLSVGDEVSTNWHIKCEGVVFVIFEIREHHYCESKALVQVHVKGEPEKVLKTSDGRGFDTNWFKKIE